MRGITHRPLRVEKLEDRRLLAVADLVISEFMATNVTTYPDYFSEYPDWIEIRNLEAFTVDLSDYSLTDNDSNLEMDVPFDHSSGRWVQDCLCLQATRFQRRAYRRLR